MDYCLDTGGGTASMWTAHPDIDLNGDGVLDGVRLDFDGDGAFDDALADFDGDGTADHAALDLDDDGVAEARYSDDGSGAWALAGGAATGGPPSGPMRWFGLDGVQHIGPAADGTDVDGDGGADRLLDINRDGLADRALIVDADGRLNIGYADVDGDGRWDLKLVDGDGDGAADQAAEI